jgi:hypothetical protein
MPAVSITTPAQIAAEKLLRERMKNFVESKANKSISFNLKNHPMIHYWELDNYRTDTYSGEKVELKSVCFSSADNSSTNIRLIATGFDFKNATVSIEFINTDTALEYHGEHIKSIHAMKDGELLIKDPMMVKRYNGDGTVSSVQKSMATILISVRIGL